MTATHVMVDDVAVRMRAQLLGLSNPGGQMAPAATGLFKSDSPRCSQLKLNDVMLGATPGRNSVLLAPLQTEPKAPTLPSCGRHAQVRTVYWQTLCQARHVRCCGKAISVVL